jgi:hypothetical protein
MMVRIKIIIIFYCDLGDFITIKSHYNYMNICSIGGSKSASVTNFIIVPSENYSTAREVA